MIKDKVKSGKLRLLLGWCVAILGCLTASFAWSVSSPVGASPDEQAHIYYAWGTATGQVSPWTLQTHIDADGISQAEIVMPDELLEFIDPGCYKGYDFSPTCAIPFYDDGADVMVDSYMARYPPTYYFPIGVFMRLSLALGVSGAHTLLAARIVSALISLALLLLAAAILTRRFPWKQVSVVFALALVPMAFFLFASINPNGLEMALAMLLAALVISIRRDQQERGSTTRPMQVLLPLVVLALAWTRPVSIVWTGLLLLPLLLPAGRGEDAARTPSFFRLSPAAIAATIVALLAGGVWFIYQFNGASLDTSSGDLTHWEGLDLWVKLVAILLRFGEMVVIGFGSLGWLDTPMPMLMILAWLVLTTAVLVRLATGAARTCIRFWHVAAVSLLAMVAIGVESYVAVFGWQGRYWFPMIMASMVLLIPLLQGRALSSRSIDRTRSATVGAMALVVTIALFINMARYRYGYDLPHLRFEEITYPWRDAVWKPSGGVALFEITAFLTPVLLEIAWRILGPLGERASVFSSRADDADRTSDGALGNATGAQEPAVQVDNAQKNDADNTAQSSTPASDRLSARTEEVL